MAKGRGRGPVGERRVRIGTRRSELARRQSLWVAGRLEAAHPGLRVELVPLVTRGDLVLDRTLDKVGGKGLFVEEIERALQRGEIDVAVHSAKDLPIHLGEGLCLGAVSPRADPRDALLAGPGARLENLPPGARVGTSSLRRAAFLRHLRPDLRVTPVRGNVDTRLQRLREGRCDALLLAVAGLERLDRTGEVSERLDPERFLPAVGQGFLAVECREADAEIRGWLAAVDDPAAGVALVAERGFLARLEGGCHLPAGAYARVVGDRLVVDGAVAGIDGQPYFQARREGPADPEEAALLGRELAEEIVAAGADRILERVRAGLEEVWD